MRRTFVSAQPSTRLRRRQALAPWLEALEARQLLTVFEVTSTADSGAGTLRDAINQVNADTSDSPSAPDTIEFELTTGNVITLDSPLVVNNPVNIDGYSQTGASINKTAGGSDEQETDVAVIEVQLDGSGATPTAGAPGLITLVAPNCTVDGLSITGFTGAGIALLPPPNSPNGSVGDDVWGNFIGVASFDPNSFNELPVVSPTATSYTHVNALGNTTGILVQSSNNRIGGTLPQERNVVQGNHGDGVQLAGAAGTGNLVEGNFILDNDSDGVDVTTSNNLIGEAIGAGPAGGGNVISGNNYGVAIIGPAASGNILVNNEIGTNVGLEGVTPPIRGMSARPNQFDGVLIQDAPGNVVGGLLADSKNVIASNGLDGISIENLTTQDATNNLVQGNWIGFNLRNGVVAILPNRDGINISSADNTVGGTTGAARNIIDNNSRNGITITSMSLDASNLTPVPIPNADPTGNVVVGNYIGTEGGGDHFGNTLDGILIEDASGNTIGGTTSAAQNVISGNNDGLVINNDTTTAGASSDNVIQGNDIGLMSDDTTPLPNAVDGLVLSNASGNTIGGTTAGAANILSGNNNGLHITGAGASDNVVEGNFVGTDQTGTIGARNSVDGILIDDGASDNTIGGTSADTRNIISGNQYGVAINGAASTANVVEGNYVGVAADGSSPLPNSDAGVLVDNAAANTIGGTVTGAANVLSANGTGVYLTGASASGNVVEGNFIGTDATGVNPVGNATDGVLINTGATGNTIGGTIAAAGNVIEFNNGNGVNVTGVGNSILSNEIDSNGPLGIALADYTGPLTSFTITSVDSDGVSSTVIQGQITSTTTAPVTLQFFSNPANASPSYNYEGQTLLVTQTVVPNGTSSTSFSVTIPEALNSGQVVTFTATDSNNTTSDNTTSEFSAGMAVTSATQPQVFTVTNINDFLDPTKPGYVGSLRWAINQVNLPQNLPPTFNDKIVFDIPGSGQQTIELVAPLPVITNPVAIEGYTQPGSVLNAPVTTVLSGAQATAAGITSTTSSGLGTIVTTNANTGTTTITSANTFAGVINVRLDGRDAGSSSGTLQGLLTIAALNCQVSGLSITGYAGGAAILLLPGATPDHGGIGDVIFGNIIGETSFQAANDSGTPVTNPVGNAEGIVVESSNNVIGGETLNVGVPLPSQGSTSAVAGANVIQGNNGPGLVFQGVNGTGNIVGADFILDNETDGVLILTSNNFIGQAIGGQGNVISGNGANGVEIQGSAAKGNVVVDNNIGTDADGATSRPNLQDGVLIMDAPGNIIGGLGGLTLNVIGSNGYDGVSIQNGPDQDAINNLVEGNDIGFNGQANASVGSGGLGPNFPILPNRDGVNISAANNTVGGTVPAAANIIVFNWRNGVTISSTLLDSNNDELTPIADATPTGNVVEGNLIGNFDGSDYGNTLEGVLINAAPNNTIGGTIAGARNVISGNNDGVVINDPASAGNVVEGNYIGPMADGATILNEAVDGVQIDNAIDNTIGGTTAGAANVISGNNWGVHLTGANATGNVVEGNFIGTDSTGATAVRNSEDGVLIDDNASNNTIGGTAAGAGNTIGFNVASGVAITSGTGDSILTNSIFSNDRIGIDLVAPGDPANGVTPNHTGVAIGPNDLLNYPTLTFAASDGTSNTSIEGTYNGLPNTTYLIQFFSSPVSDPSGFGQGQTYIGSTMITTDASGNATIAPTLNAVVANGQYISATATAPDGSTSEFSNTVPTVPVEIGFGAASYSVDQAAGTITILVTRDHAGDGGTVTVAYATGGGTAVAGVNYTPVSGTLTFDPGVDDQSFQVPVIDDPAVTPSTTVDLTLSDPTGGATINSPNPVVLTIQNNNVPEAQFSASSYPVSESGGLVTITVTRNTGTDSASVAYATSNGTALAGTDYTAKSGILTFSAGQTSESFTIPIIDSHKTGGGIVTVNLSLSNPSGLSLGAPSTATVDIKDDDLAGALQFNSSTYSVVDTASAALITVQRTGGVGGQVSINYATGVGTAVPGQDYTPVSGTLIFSPGQTSASFSVPILNHLLTSPITIPLTLSNPMGGATLGPVSHVTLSIGVNTALPPVRAGNFPGPVVQNLQMLTNGQGITGIVLSFNEPLNATRAQTLANYGSFFITAGADGIFGTGDDGSVYIASATYIAPTNQVVLTPAYPLPLNMIIKLAINTQASTVLQTGLTDTSGVLLDGVNNGQSGTPYVSEFGIGSRLQYLDASANQVTLSLARGGLMELNLGANGNAQELQFLGPVAKKSTLTGQVRGPRVGRAAASTTIGEIVNPGNAVRIKLTRAFRIGEISAAAVDAILAPRRKG